MKSLIFIAFALFAHIPPPTTSSSLEKPLIGANQYGAVTLEALQTIGLLKLTGTTITQTLELQGSLIARDAHLSTLSVEGETNFTSCTISGTCRLIGFLQAGHTTFLGPLHITGQKAVFTACRLQAITIQQDASYRGKQVLELRQGTSVEGPIHFASGKGEVIVWPGAKILSQVTGAKVLKK